MARMKPTDIDNVATLARQWNLDPAGVLAVVQVESGGLIGATVEGRMEPLIRFEGHSFDRLLPPAKRAEARKAGLASPNAGAIRNPRGQADRHALVARASRIDRAAAIQSCSWGVGQVMGSHWQALGFDTPESLVATARSGLVGQVEIMLRFIVRGGHDKALNGKRWAEFARRYNGPAFRRNRYDEKLAKAYRRFATLLAGVKGAAPGPGPAQQTLRMGSRGAEVEALQRLLTAAGFAVETDGLFGSETLKALRGFQQNAKLVVDGLYGSATRQALEQAVPQADVPAHKLGRLLYILSWLARMIARFKPPSPR